MLEQLKYQKIMEVGPVVVEKLVILWRLLQKLSQVANQIILER